MKAGWWTAVKPGWWVALTVIAGMAAGIAWPPPPIPRAKQTGDLAWTLPSRDSLQRLTPEAAAQVSQGLRWPGENAGSADASAEGSWKLAGIMRDPAPAALVQLANGKIEQFTEGSSLPDGGSVLKIGSDEVTVERDGCAQSHRLHHPPPAENSNCLAKQ